MISTFISVSISSNLLVAAHQDINKEMGVIYPDSTFKGIWDLLGLIFIIYQSIIIPFRLCFEADAEGGILVFETIIDFTFMLDIRKSFFTNCLSCLIQHGVLQERVPGYEEEGNNQELHKVLVLYRFVCIVSLLVGFHIRCKWRRRSRLSSSQNAIAT